VGSAVFSGGSTDDLAALVAAAGGDAVWAQDPSGSWVRYSTTATGSTAFVNAAFDVSFSAGFPAATAVFVVKTQAPSTPSPTPSATAPGATPTPTPTPPLA